MLAEAGDHVCLQEREHWLLVGNRDAVAVVLIIIHMQSCDSFCSHLWLNQGHAPLSWIHVCVCLCVITTTISFTDASPKILYNESRVIELNYRPSGQIRHQKVSGFPSLTLCQSLACIYIFFDCKHGEWIQSRKYLCLCP